MNFSSYQVHKQHSFDTFCKTVLRNEVRNDQKARRRKRKRETPISDLTAREQSGLAAPDTYPHKETRFQAAGYSVTVRHEELAGALASLPQDKRDVVLLHYFLGMTDKQIGEKLNIVRRTVSYKRTISLQEMKQLLESED